MSAGSGASNLGYGNVAPLSNINGNYVNVGNTNNPANFSSNEIPGLPGLAGAKNNVDAAAGIVPGICLKGGAKKLKTKIKNITKIYKKMKGGTRRKNSLKRSLRALTRSRSASRARSFQGGKRRTYKHTRTHRRKRHMKGGYSQYQNNLPMTPSYSVGGVLPASQLALANPPPISVLPNCTNCVDNYNHYTNMGSPSRGH